LPRSEQHELCTDEFKFAAEAFLELFELLEDYAPIWYTEQHHNRAVVVRRNLAGALRQRGSSPVIDSASAIPPLDVFSIRDDKPTWLGPAESLEQVLEIIRKNGAGSYLIFSQKTRHKARYEVDTNGAVKPIDSADPQDA